MIKFTAKRKDRTLVGIGLSFGNLDKFRAEPRETFIRIDGKEMGIPVDIMIFSGETEAAMGELLQQFIGPDTEIHVDGKLKS